VTIGKRIRVLVVDDSAFMRKAIVKMLESGADIEVVGSAASGEEGITLARDLRPDIVTMDVEMPGIGGLEAARAIIAGHGPPVIMISSLTRQGAETTLRALEIGAVDFIPKPDSSTIDILRVKGDLVEKVRFFGSRAARNYRPRGPAAEPAPQVVRVEPRSPATRVPLKSAFGVNRVPFECIVIGTSTGGPVALTTILPKLPPGSMPQARLPSSRANRGCAWRRAPRLSRRPASKWRCCGQRAASKCASKPMSRNPYMFPVSMCSRRPSGKRSARGHSA
jgi:two-component system chemotaxis response regulator CheB